MGSHVKREYLVEGMTCSGCERAIQRVVSTVDGVKGVKADLATSTVSLEYDPSKATIDDIRSAVTKIGYKFVGERPPHGQKEGRDDAVS
jgi:copper chaperone CopZ